MNPKEMKELHNERQRSKREEERQRIIKDKEYEEWSKAYLYALLSFHYPTILTIKNYNS